MVMPGLQDAHIHGVSVGNPVCSLDYQPLTEDEFIGRLEACLADPAYGEGDDA